MAKIMLLLVSMSSMTYGFLREFSSLKTIVSSQALISSITSRANMELLNESVIIEELTKFQHHPLINTLSIGLIAATAIFYYKNGLNECRENRWRNIELFSEQRRVINIIILIFLIIFTKNIENAI